MDKRKARSCWLGRTNSRGHSRRDQEALEQAQIEDPTRTSLIIAHRLSTIRSCDLIYVLDKGQVIESGTHTELIQRRGMYYKMLEQGNA